MAGVPSGYHFLPTEEELLGYYLTTKVYRTDPLFNNNIIPDYCDVFHTIPEDLPGDSMIKRYFFVTSSDANKLDIISTGGGGYWEAIGTEEDIEVVFRGKRVRAMKRFLVFYRQTDIPTPWVMHEYRLLHSDDVVIPNSTDKCSGAKEDWVVCCVKEKKRKPVCDSEELFVSGSSVMDFTSDEEDDSELPQPSSKLPQPSSSSSSSSFSSS